MATDKRELLLIIRGKDQGAKAALEGVADAAEDAEDDLGDFNKGLKKLDAQMAETGRRAAMLRAEIARSGDLGLVKDLEKAERELKKLGRQRKILIPVELDIDKDIDRGLGDAGRKGAEGFSLGFAQRIGPLIAKAPIGPGLLGAVAAAVPIVAPAVTNMIALGAAGGAVALGAAISTKDPRVAAGIASLKEDIGNELAESAKPFTPAMLREIDDVRGHFRSLRPDLDAVFAKASTYLDPLENGLSGLVRNALPGLKSLVDAAEPLVEVFAEELPELGEDFAVLMKDVASAAREGKDEFRATLDILGLIVRTSGNLLPIFTKLNGAVELWNANLEGANIKLEGAGILAELAAEKFNQNRGGKHIEGRIKETEELGNVFSDAGDKALVAGEKVRGFFEIVREGANQSLDAREAQRQFEQAIDDATETIEKNGKGLDINTQKGRDNQAALDAIRREAYNAAGAVREMGGSQETANGILERGRQKFIAAAIAAGMEKSAAVALAASLFKLPDVNKTIRYNDKPARDAIARVIAAGGRVKDIVRGIYYTTHGDLKVPGGTQIKNSMGGYVTGPGTSTSDSIPARLSDGEYVVRAAAVDRIGVQTLDAINRGSGDARRMLMAATARNYAPRTARPAAQGVDPQALAAALNSAVDRAVRGSEERLIRALSRATLRIDDRTAKLADLYVRGG